MRQPTRRRSAGTGGNRPAVDYANLTRLVVRRCEGCPPEVHHEVAQRFLEAKHFGTEVQERVEHLLDRYLAANGRPAPVQDGSTVCAACHQRFYDHPGDEERPWLTALCDGRVVQLV